jgi:hypothetical protein
MPNRPLRARLALPFLLLALAAAAPVAGAKLPGTAELRSWIEGFKASPKGPFLRIRWFCKDGTVQPPKAYACGNHGGGIQHGEWNDRAKALRAGGYTVANVLASLDPKEFVGSGADLFALRQILIERFLIGRDDGWIFRGARTYRGALQIEDEEAGSRRVVRAMLEDRRWREPERFLLLRETVRLLPLQADEAKAASVRKQALVLAEKDKAFTPLRAKIHNQPDAGDAADVRAYAQSKGKASLRGGYDRLASDIDALYGGGNAAELARALAPRVGGLSSLSKSLAELGRKLEKERDPTVRVAIAGRLMGLLRQNLPKIDDADVAVDALQLSVALEADGVASAGRAESATGSLPRKRRLELLDQTAEALFGAGLLSVDQLGEVKAARKREKTAVLAKPPSWAERALASEFGKAIAHLTPLEPEAKRFDEDRLQQSLVPFYRAVAGGLGS